ncbi:PP2C family protein-serine/threonine phosphatase [Streptomyces sp. URMC 123]|uniref:PP2C family protein-serine/threonine phosphatase n=1 Tax=Streptomyces sp. URMC 123 TaxID=3423403 RepID=UPI003F1E1FAC
MAYIVVSALSHPGLVRDRNEDSLAVGPWTVCGTITENPQTMLFPLGTPLIVAVADGLGGHPAGEVASAMVVRRLSRIGPALESEDDVRDALEGCNRAVYEAADDDPDLIMMGTTVAGVVLTADHAIAFNVGDSRVYDVADGQGLREVSVDDNPPLLPGERTSSIVTQTLGGTPGFSPVDPHVSGSPLDTERRWLVCSDGLTDPVPDAGIDEVLRFHSDGRAAFELWKAAMNGGGPDNITLALVRIGD